MKLAVNKNYKKARRFCIPGSEDIWFEIEPILKREQMVGASDASKFVKKGKKTEQEFNSKVFFDFQYDQLSKKIKNFGGITDKESGIKLEYSKANLEMLLDSSWRTEICKKKDRKGKIVIDEDTGEPEMVELGTWLYQCATETEQIEGELEN